MVNAWQRSATSYDEWADAYGDAYEDPQTLPDVACPSCGVKTLNLRFSIHLEIADRGLPAFWCSTCEQGLMFCHVTLPPWAEYLLTDPEAAAAQKVGIPAYRFIPPESSDADESETS